MANEADDLKRRIAERLGWPAGGCDSLSLQACRELVKGKSPKLAYLCDELIRSGRYLIGDPAPELSDPPDDAFFERTLADMRAGR